jgi:outer membrane protein assembly factor BamB
VKRVNEPLKQRHARLAREKTLYRYTAALEDGDLETIAAVWQKAEQDRLLEQAILEMHALYQETADITAPLPEAASELLPGPTVEALPAHVLPSGTNQQRGRRRLWESFAQQIVAVLLVGLLLSSFLALYLSHQGARNTVGVGPSSVVVLGRASGFSAFRPGDGSLLWTYPTEHPIVEPSIVVQADTVYAATADGLLYALRASDGALLWQEQTNGTSDGYVLLRADGNVVVVGYLASSSGDFADGKRSSVAAFDARNGHLLWQRPEQLSEFFNPLLGLDNHAVYIEETSPQGIFTRALRETDGTVLWSHPSLIGIQTANMVAITNGALYLSGSQTLQALEAQTGKQLWENQQGGIGAGTLNGIVAGDGHVYLSTGGEICAYQMSNGRQGWCISAYEGSDSLESFVSSLLFMDGTLYGGRLSDVNPDRLTIEAWDASTGKQRWSLPGNNRGFIGAEGVLYTLTAEGLTALRGSDGHQLWLARINLDAPEPIVIAVG